MKRALGVLAVLAASALAQNEPGHSIHVWCAPRTKVPPAELLRISNDGRTGALVHGTRVDGYDLEDRELADSVNARGRILALSEDGRSALGLGPPNGNEERELFSCRLDGSDRHSTLEWTRDASRRAVFARHKGRALTCGADGIGLWDLKTGGVLQRIPRPFARVVEISDSSVLTFGPSGAQLWSFDTGFGLPLPREFDGLDPDGIAHVPSSTRVVVCVHERLEILDTAGLRRAVATTVNVPLLPPLAVSRRGDQILAADPLGTIHVFDSALEELLALRGHHSLLRGLAISRDGTKALSSSADGELIRWDLTAGKDLDERPGHSGAITAIAVSADGKLALTGSADRSVRLWDVVTGAQLRAFQGHDQRVVSVAFSADGKKAASADAAGRLIAWDVASGAVQESVADVGSVVAVGFDGAGRLLRRACPRRESVALLPGGRGLHAGAGKLEVLGAAGEVEKVIETGGIGLDGDFALATPDGKRAFVSFGDQLQLVDVEKGRFRTFENTPRRVHPVAISPDGKLGVDSAGNFWALEGGFVVDAGFEGSAVAFVDARSLVVGQKSGRLERIDR